MMDINSDEYKKQRDRLLMERYEAQQILKNPEAPQELVNLAKPVFDKAEVALSLMDAEQRRLQRENASKPSESTLPTAVTRGNQLPQQEIGGLEQSPILWFAAKTITCGWFMGLAYYNWFATNPPHVAWWKHILLVVVVDGLAVILIGGGVALLISSIVQGAASKGKIAEKLIIENSYAWSAFIAPVIVFFAAKYALLLAASF